MPAPVVVGFVLTALFGVVLLALWWSSDNALREHEDRLVALEAAVRELQEPAAAPAPPAEPVPPARASGPATVPMAVAIEAEHRALVDDWRSQFTFRDNTAVEQEPAEPTA